MAKRHENETRDRSRDFARDTRTRSSEDVLGSPRSAFGEGGLATDRHESKLRRNLAFNDAHAGFKSGMDTGGYDPDVVSKIREGYSRFSDTGGISPEEEAAFRRRATSGIGGIYEVLGNDAERRRSATGGLGTGGDISRMARQVSQEQARAATGAEVDLAGIRRSGRQFGLSGGTALEGNIAGNRLQATGGMANLFNTTTGEVSDFGRQILAQYGLSDASQETQLAILRSLAGTPGIMDNIQQGIGIAGSVAGGIGGFSSGGLRGASAGVRT